MCTSTAEEALRLCQVGSILLQVSMTTAVTVCVLYVTRALQVLKLHSWSAVFIEKKQRLPRAQQMGSEPTVFGMWDLTHTLYSHVIL